MSRHFDISDIVTVVEEEILSENLVNCRKKAKNRCCHHCKVRRRDVTACDNCQLVYCNGCVDRIYGDIALVLKYDNVWICYKCSNKCKCGKCRGLQIHKNAVDNVNLCYLLPRQSCAAGDCTINIETLSEKCLAMRKELESIFKSLNKFN